MNRQFNVSNVTFDLLSEAGPVQISEAKPGKEWRGNNQTAGKSGETRPSRERNGEAKPSLTAAKNLKPGTGNPKPETGNCELRTVN
jgi:hypothetical protein